MAKKWQTDFNKTKPEHRATWTGWAEHAEKERIDMMGEFHVYAMKKRRDTEDALICRERTVAELEPFARAGLDASETPADVPLVVIEFAVASLDLMENRRMMALLDVYYKSSATMAVAEYLTINPGDEAEINQLWEMFLEDRKENDSAD